MSEEKQLSEQESLQLITQMIQKAKAGFHEKGTSAILWGSVVAVCGLVSAAQAFFDFRIGFDIWLLTMAAIIPQVLITIKEQRERKAVSHLESAMNAIWLVYGISIFALVFYFNAVPGATETMLKNEGITITQTNAAGKTSPYHLFIFSHGSLLMLLYAIPTLATGIACKFRPMFWGAILCYTFFIISCFTPFAYDMLLNGFAGIFNWLIPGLILRARYLKQKRTENV